MNPLFLGDVDKQIFGVYHEPQNIPYHDKGVLICPAIGFHYPLTHWALRRLASALATNGIPVLRFDFFGTGDSAGQMLACSVDQWRKDIAQAAQELSDISGASKITLVGLQLGAMIAATASHHELVEKLILLDPPASGKAHIEHLEYAHSLLEKQFSRIYQANSNYKSDQFRELVGTRYSLSLLKEIQQLHFPSICREVRGELSVILTDNSPDTGALRNELIQMDALQPDCANETCSDWREKLENREQLTINNELIRQITNLIMVDKA